MIRFEHGNILEAQTEALVNAVNCAGVMGRGIALQFKNTFPANFKAYVAACKLGEVQPGRMFVFDTGKLTSPRFIINFPTKRHWRDKSRIEDIRSGLNALVEEVRSRGIRSIAIPPLGCGLGGLDWPQVRSLIERAMMGLEVEVEVLVFEPCGGRAQQVKPECSCVHCIWTGPTVNGRCSLCDAEFQAGREAKLRGFLGVENCPHKRKLRFSHGGDGDFRPSERKSCPWCSRVAAAERELIEGGRERCR